MSAREALAAALAHARHLLPAQSPLDRFVHHNPLHAFEHLPFAEAVESAAYELGNAPWWPEARYRDAWRDGRIRDADLDAAIAAAIDDARLAPGLTRRALAGARLRYGIEPLGGEALAWRLSETDALTAPRADLDPARRAGVLEGHQDPAWAIGRLWAACRRRAATGARALPAPEGPRVRDLFVARLGHDPDLAVHGLLVRWLAAWLDHGIAAWPMEGRAAGLLPAIAEHLRAVPALRPWVRGLGALLGDGRDAERVALAALAALGHPPEAFEAVVTASLLALRGYAGMVQRLADAPDHAPVALGFRVDLLDLLALRLALDATAAAHALGPGVGTPLARARALPGRSAGPAADPAWTLFQTLQALGLGAGALARWSDAELRAVEADPLMVDDVLRRRIGHAAYEARHQRVVLDAIALHRPEPAPAPAWQAIFCIDDREESLRRHLEELAPEVETFGVAGNFGIAMSYGGPSRSIPIALAAAGVPIRHRVVERDGRPRVTRDAGSPEIDGLRPGFTVDEQVAIVRGTLRAIGLVRGFAPLVLVLGHGAHTVNNPHAAAYQCGACGGARGRWNARVFAWMANDPAVRAGLAAAGIRIPDGTWFLAGEHDTCDDRFQLDDLDRVPAGLLSAVDRARRALERAGARDAVERCRRFETAPLGLTEADAVRHVRRRALDLAEPRPEYGHGTNAVAVIGRRARTRGLFLDRRAFLVSYDPTRDADGDVLARLLAQVLPVGSGINLEYLFGALDPERYGSGTKLAHNLTGLLGVMDGHASDLRTGLPWQTLELHEPVRLLCIIEALPDAIGRAVSASPAAAQLVERGWVRVAALSPDGSELLALDAGAWVPWLPEATRLPHVRASIDWFGGARGHLPPASIGGRDA